MLRGVPGYGRYKELIEYDILAPLMNIVRHTISFKDDDGAIIDDSTKTRRPYKGRLAPTPSGKMHLGHAQTFWFAQERAARHLPNSSLILRVEDLDQARCKPHFLCDIISDLKWFGIEWDYGPGSTISAINEDIRHSESLNLQPFEQSKRSHLYVAAWKVLYEKGFIYPSPHSRKDVERALSAPHDEDNNHGEAIFPISLRCPKEAIPLDQSIPGKVNWRFRIPDGRQVTFIDGRCGECSYTAGVDFGDFIVWRSDGFASYELAVVVDDHSMGITEVVRGEDLLMSTARQLLLYEALDATPPAFYHCPLVKDADGRRLAKRDCKGTEPALLPVTGPMIAPVAISADENGDAASPPTMLPGMASELPGSVALEGGLVGSAPLQSMDSLQPTLQSKYLSSVCIPDMIYNVTEVRRDGGSGSRTVISLSSTLQSLRESGWTGESIRKYLFQVDDVNY